MQGRITLSTWVGSCGKMTGMNTKNRSRELAHGGRCYFMSSPRRDCVSISKGFLGQTLVEGCTAGSVAVSIRSQKGKSSS
jgi:hypothetical protein